ncbi:MAG TPA: hypothetical protein VEX62_05040 [Candidatus Limnocylindrales bacterium]|jgi:hypothetical protein|nr:hypothetical protein [Candidatus Limnocylindrales bacterium]
MSDQFDNREDQQTGTGSPRSAESGDLVSGQSGNSDAETDSAVVGATTGSHPAASDDEQINRSGSGGTGGPADDEEPADG